MEALYGEEFLAALGAQRGGYPSGFAPDYPPTMPPSGGGPLIISFPLYFLRFLALGSIGYAFIKRVHIKKSVLLLIKNIKPRRLVREEEGVKGCGWFAKFRERPLHVVANLLRVACTFAFAPILLFPPVIQETVRMLRAYWKVEHSRPYNAVLARAPSSQQPALYEVTGFEPQWMLKVTFGKDGKISYKSVNWSVDIRNAGYTAISYAMDSARVLFDEAREELAPRSPGDPRAWSLDNRKQISKKVLTEYASAKYRSGTPDPVEYIWLDEFCLSDPVETDASIIESQRSAEVGRLVDIFGGARKVVVFCHNVGCDHADLDCVWGTRIFTLTEILNAKQVIRMTREFVSSGGGQQPQVLSTLYPESAIFFRQRMQNRAESASQWHLHTIMKHAANAGAFTWQNSIHSLIVETIRRDEAGGFVAHRFLGKALNGLLPRRARLADLHGRDGWADLAWLLEINQGYYNAASLAAICSVSDIPGISPTSVHPWLGKPILPAPGVERLEPIVTAFPVINPQGGTSSALSIVGPHTIPVQTIPQRDRDAFYRNEDMFGLRVLNLVGLVTIFWLDIELVMLRSPIIGVLLLWGSVIGYSGVKLLTSTMHIVRRGWICLEDHRWGSNPEQRLGEQDHHLATLAHWGGPGSQIVPTWQSTSDPKAVTLVDLENEVYVQTVVTDIPNALIPLAVHGTGITCMLVQRSDDAGKVTERLGMVNLPTYVLSQSTKCGSVCIGGKAID